MDRRTEEMEDRLVSERYGKVDLKWEIVELMRNEMEKINDEKGLSDAEFWLYLKLKKAILEINI